MQHNSVFTLFATVLLSASAAAALPPAAHVVKSYVGSFNTPMELTVQNESSGSMAMTEVRAIGTPKDGGACAMDLGVTGDGWDNPQDETLAANESFLVGESTCDSMHIKSNNGVLKLSTVSENATLKTFALLNGRMFFPVTEACGANMQKPHSGAVLCAAADGFYLATSEKITKLSD